MARPGFAKGRRLMDFPPRVQMLIDEIGIDHALQVVKAFGGLPLYVPRKHSPELEARLGAECYAAVWSTFPGESLGQIPKCHAEMLKARNAQWLASHRNGTTIVALAQQNNLTWLTVHNGIGKAREGQPDTRQGSLFDL